MRARAVLLSFSRFSSHLISSGHRYAHRHGDSKLTPFPLSFTLTINSCHGCPFNFICSRRKQSSASEGNEREASLCRACFSSSKGTQTRGISFPLFLWNLLCSPVSVNGRMRVSAKLSLPRSPFHFLFSTPFLLPESHSIPILGAFIRLKGKRKEEEGMIAQGTRERERERERVDYEMDLRVISFFTFHFHESEL